MSTTRAARHRAARRPMTPLSTIAQVAADQMSTVSRRTAVVAASSGLIVSMIGVAAPASAITTNTDSPQLSTVDLDALTAQARAALESAPALTVAADATFTIETAPVTVTPAPEPEPEPEPAPEPVRQQNTSRTEERVAPPQREEAAPEAAPQAEAPKAEAPEAEAEDNTQSEQAAEDEAASDEADAPASANGDAVVSIAARYLGVPYVYGGSTPNGFDCSGFTSYVYAQLGIDLPRTSSQQRYAGRVVSRSQAQPGDLIWSPGHIAIYVGGNQQIEAPVPGKSVHYSNIWQSNPTFIRVL